MGRRLAAITAAALLASLVVLSAGSSARAQASQPVRDIPQSIRLEHEETIRQLTVFTKRRTPTGAIARKALDLFKAHIQREEEYILPPLTLVPAISEGRVTPDMRWAIAMADRIKADREAIFVEHTAITTLMSELAVAAQRSHESDVFEFAQAAVADSLHDLEVTAPAAVVIGEYLRLKLPPGK